MHVNTKLHTAASLRGAGCVRVSVMKSILSVCFCPMFTWHHKPPKLTEICSQRGAQLMMVIITEIAQNIS